MLMLALFAFSSSHPLLENLGLIHQEVAHADGPAHSEDNHEAADGSCRIESGQEELQIPLADALDLSHGFVFMCVLMLTVDPDADPGGRNLRPPPPELDSSWQFSSRAALPIRAPSLAS